MLAKNALRTLSFEHDRLGRVVAVQDPDFLGTLRRSFAADGFETFSCDGAGRRITNTISEDTAGLTVFPDHSSPCSPTSDRASAMRAEE